MEGLMTLLTLGSVAAVAIPLALLLERWSVRGLLALVGGPVRFPDSGGVHRTPHTGADRHARSGR